MNKEEIKKLIKTIISDENHSRVELLLCVKQDGEHSLKRIMIDNKTEKEIRHSFSFLLKEKYTNDDTMFKPLKDLNDNQHAIYNVSQTDQYYPFNFLKNDNISEYSSEQQLSIIGYFIKFGNNNKYVNLFQQRNNMFSINNEKTFLIRKVKNVFSTMNEEIMRIEKKIDILIYNEYIFFEDSRILERFFGLETIIRKEAQTTIQKITKLGFSNLNDLLNRYQQKISHSRKLMKIAESPVFNLSKDKLIERISKIERYKNTIKIDNNEIIVKTFTDVENLIKMLGDSILVSPLTDTEYETMVKKKLDKLAPKESYRIDSI